MLDMPEALWKVREAGADVCLIPTKEVMSSVM
jgi:hypothetical protein